MFIYENGLIVDYITDGNYSEDHKQKVKDAMLKWARSLPGQSRVRLGKVGIMQGQEVNLKRMENE